MGRLVGNGLFAFALMFAAFALSDAKATDDGPVILTITGKIGQANREAFDPFMDGIFKARDKRFERAFTFTRAALSALPQVEITAHAQGFPRAVKLKGPRLGDVLAAAKAEAGDVTVYALDGYGWKMDKTERAAREWVLALAADGKALAIGGRGPLWLAYDTGAGRVGDDEEAKWVWAVFHIAVE